MRLDFNVLWVENQPHLVKSQRQRIESQIKKEGFKLQVEFASSVAAAKQLLGSDIFGDHVDLVLMDYDLGAGPKGDEGLVMVRELFSYKDIVFYSANAPDLLPLVSTKKLQGVFCSIRDDLPDTVVGVFEALVKKVLDIDHSRGIVMGATSDIDHFVNDCLVTVFKKGDAKSRASALSIIASRMKEIRKRFEKDAAKVDAVTEIEHLFDLHNVYTSVDRLNLLRKLLEQGGKHAEHCEAMQVYSSSTVPKRNDLAHVRVHREGFSRKLYDRSGKQLTSNEMRELRRSLLEHQEQIEALASALKGTS
jgi:hypothetical protein